MLKQALMQSYITVALPMSNDKYFESVSSVSKPFRIKVNVFFLLESFFKKKTVRLVFINMSLNFRRFRVLFEEFICDKDV